MKFTMSKSCVNEPAQPNKSRAMEKHQVRRYFSGQLESLWKLHPTLKWFDESGDIQRAHAKKFECRVCALSGGRVRIDLRIGH
jgi:hypothetical protein